MACNQRIHNDKEKDLISMLCHNAQSILIHDRDPVC